MHLNTLVHIISMLSQQKSMQNSLIESPAVAAIRNSGTLTPDPFPLYKHGLNMSHAETWKSDIPVTSNSIQSDTTPYAVTVVYQEPLKSSDKAKLKVPKKYKRMSGPAVTALVPWHPPMALPVANQPTESSDKKDTEMKEILKEVLVRTESQMKEKLHDLYLKIAKYNSFWFETAQSIQYLSYSSERKQRIYKERAEIKQNILDTYEKFKPFVTATEKYRAKLLTWDTETSKNIPYTSPFSYYWPEQNPLPESWYLVYNLETIMLQLFTPKPAILTFFDDETKKLHIFRKATVPFNPRGFIPLPENSSAFAESKPLDQLFDLENNHDLSAENLERKVFSTDDLEQKIMVYYTFKYFEYRSGDLAREVQFIVKRLQNLESRGKKDSAEFNWELKDLELKYAEMQFAIEQMEVYRSIPEMVNVFNAESMAHKYLENAKYVTKIIGKKNEQRVALKSIDEILFDQNNNGNNEKRQTVSDPVEYDKNWTWDF